MKVSDLLRQAYTPNLITVDEAKEIATFIMKKGSVTPHDLVKEFGLALVTAKRIYSIQPQAFGPGGKGFTWYVNKISAMRRDGR